MLLATLVAGTACAASPPAARTAPAAATQRLGPPAPALPYAADPRRSPELFVRCENRASCPNAVGMLVVEDDARPAPERCTATLIAPDRAVTASHCIAAADRRAAATCTRTWLSFPETADAPAEWVACARVVRAAEVVDPSALHQEYAVLLLGRPLSRTPLAVDPSPPPEGSIVTVVSVTPHPVYGSTHALSTRLCRAIDASAARAALGPAAAAVGWLSDCPIAHGNSGSPVIDHAGRVRAIVHGGTALTSAFGVTSTIAH